MRRHLSLKALFPRMLMGATLALIGALASTSTYAANNWVPIASISATSSLVTNSLCYTDGTDLLCDGSAPASSINTDHIVSGTTGMYTYNNTSATIATGGVERIIVGTNGSIGIGVQPINGIGLTISGTSVIYGRLSLNTLTNNNLLIGSSAGASITGTDNAGVGYGALQSNSGSYVAAFGRFAAQNNTGGFVTAMGTGAAQGNSAANVVAFGANAAQNNSPSDVTAIGTNSAQANRSGGGFSTFVGANSGQFNGGQYSTGLGYSAAQNSSGNLATFVGSYAGQYNGGNNVIGVGYNAAANNTGNNVTALGHLAAIKNTADSVTALGYNAVNTGVSNTFTNITGLGYDAQPTKSNQIMLGNTAVTEVFSYGAGIFNLYVRPGSSTTAGLPSPSTAGAGAIMYDNSVNNLKYSDGTTWNAIGSTSGTTVSTTTDNITSGTTSVTANSTGYISLTTAGVTTGYFDTAGLLVAPGVSITTANGISSTNGYFSSNVGIGQQPTTTSAFAVTGASTLTGALTLTRATTGITNLTLGNALTTNTLLIQYNKLVSGNDTANRATIITPNSLFMSAGNLMVIGNSTSTTSGTVATLDLNTNGRVGVGLQTAGGYTSANAPSTTLHVSGTLRIADGGETCDQHRVGAIKYASGDFYICRNATSWETLAGTANTSATTTDNITSGTLSVTANSTTSIVSLTTAGTTWGYLGNTASYLPQLNANVLSGTTIYTNSLKVGATQGLTIYNDLSNTAWTNTTGYSLFYNRVGTSGTSLAFKFHTTTSDTGVVYILNNGNVGIGTGTPTYPLDVSGTARATRFIGDGSGLTNVSSGDRITSGTTSMITYTNASATIATAGVERIVVGTSGNVGIGQQPTSADVLSVSGSVRIPGTSRYNLSGIGYLGSSLNYPTNGIAISNGGPGGISFETGGTVSERMRIDSTGNVGINTTAPSYPLDVSGTARATRFIGDGSGLTNISASSISGLTTDRITSGTTSVTANNTGYISLTTAGVTTGYFDTAGLLVAPGISITTTNGISSTYGYFSAPVGIGAPPSTSQALYVAGAVVVSGTQFIVSSSTDKITFFNNSGRNEIYLRANNATGNDFSIRNYNGIFSILDRPGTGPNILNVTQGTGAAGGNVGIKTQSPTTALQILGTLRIADGGEFCDVSRTGAMKYSNGDFFFCRDGANWSSIATILSSTSVDRITSGTTSAIAQTTGYVSLTTAGTTWGYLGSAGSYLPALTSSRGTFNNGIQITNRVSASTTTLANEVLSTQGAYIGWNEDVGSGMTSFMNHPGIGGGGFNFNLFNSSGNFVSTPLTINNSGKVSIGTTNSSATLDIVGSTNLDGVSNTVARFAASTPTGGLYVGSVNGNTPFIAAASGATGLTFQTGGAERVRIDASGNVGIGTNSPGSLLEVRKDQNAITGISVYNNTANASAQARLNIATGTPSAYTIHAVIDNTGAPYYQMAGGAGIQHAYLDMPDFSFRNASGTSRMVITSSGLVGISTTTPSYPLEVNGSVNALNYLIASQNAGSAGSIGFINGSGPGVQFWGNTVASQPTIAGSLLLNTSNSIRVAITSTGLVGIGTSTPVTNLHVTTGSNYASLMLGNNGGTANTHLTHETDGSFNIYTGTFGSGVKQLTITSSSNVGIGASAPAYPLEVNGIASAKSYVSKVYRAGGATAPALTFANDNVMRDLPDTTVTFTLTQPATVMFSGAISTQCNVSTSTQNFIVINLVVNNVVKTKSIASTTVHCSANVTWSEQLAAGSYTAVLRYRTNIDSSLQNTPASNDWHNRELIVTVLGNQ